MKQIANDPTTSSSLLRSVLNPFGICTPETILPSWWLATSSHA